ncbi:MAG: chorismate synthase [Flavobacteriales bacterium]|nr:chorismate synthase [Flavobacteriales bacterium]
MAGNSFGKLFRITTFGESHGAAIGVVIDGFPSGIEINETLINQDLQRRKPGQSKLTTQRKENEEFQILSGVFEGKSLGTPIAVTILNADARSKDYEHLKETFRPSHADFTYEAKYGHRDYRGGGRSSARETAARVVAGAFAKMLLQQVGIEIVAYVSSVADVGATVSDQTVCLADVEKSLVRCPDENASSEMEKRIDSVRKDGDTLGGIVRCVARNVPAGLGEPVFDKLHAELGKAMLSINAVKGFEIGSGFASTKMRGSEHNDVFSSEGGKIITETNNSGGIQGGISNGMNITFNVAFKPVATIMQAQTSVNKDGDEVTLEGKGRHDPCVVPRAVPIVEAMTAIVLADYYLRNKTQQVG